MSHIRSHPLRRVSTGSLSNLARSQDGHHPAQSSASGLDFLTSAMMDLSDEAATLASHLNHMNSLHESLGTFNEAFAGYLYALRMNAFCVEWTEAPYDVSFSRSAELAPVPAPILPPPRSPSPTPQAQAAGDQTYATIQSNHDPEEYSSPPRSGIPRGSSIRGARGGRGMASVRGRGAAVGAARGGKAPGAGASTIAERKKREATITAIIDTLPIEYRGGDPATRQSMEKVIGQLMLNPGGRKLGEIVGATGLPQAKVNKCLIALVGRKAIGKDMVGGVAVYSMN